MKRIGDFRHRVQIQRYKEIEDESHGTFKTWETIVTVYASIDNVNGLITFDTQQIGKAITHKITVRFYPFITSENWILMESRRFRIRSVTNIGERDRFLLLLCEEVFHALDPFEMNIDSVNEPLVENLPKEDS